MENFDIPADMSEFAEDMTDSIDTMQSDMLNSYEGIDFELVNNNTKDLILNYVNGVIDLYVGTEMAEEYPFLQSMLAMEHVTMKGLIKGFMYAEHMLDSFVKMVDGGGFMQTENYELFMKLHRHTMDITLEISQYIRNFPTYIKNIEDELTRNLGENSLSGKLGEKLANKNFKEGAVDIDTEDSFEVSGDARMGQRDLMVEIQKQLNDYKDNIDDTQIEKPDYVKSEE